MPAAQQRSGRANDDSETGAGTGTMEEFSEATSDAMSGVRDAASSMAERGAEAVGDVSETVKRAGRSAKARASRAAEEAQNAGGEAMRAIQAEMSDRPWTIALAAAAAAGVLGYLLGSRR
jgi:hypothetical protein